MMEPNPYIKHLAQRATGYGYIVEKETHKLLYLNPPLVVKLGGTEEELTGRPCYSTIFGHDAPCSFCRMGTTPVEGSSSWYLHHEPTQSHYVMASYLTCRDEKEYFVQMTTGITDEILEIDRLKESIMAEQMVTACANELTKGAEAMEELLHLVCDFYQASHGAVWTRNDRNQELECSAFYQDSTCSFSYDTGKTVSFSMEGSLVETLTEQGYLLLKGNQVPPELRLDSALADQAVVHLSELIAQGKTIGLLAIYDMKTNQDFLHQIHTIKMFIANSLAMKKRIGTLESQNELAQVVLSCVATLEGKGTYEQAIQGLLSIIDAYFQGARAYILRKEGEVVSMEFEHNSQQARPSYEEVNYASAAVVNGWFEEFGQEDTMVISSVAEQMIPTQENQFEYDLLVKDGVESLLGVRLFEKGKLSRFLLVDNPSIHGHQVGLLKNIASFAESHLERGKILQKLEQLSYTDSLTGLYNRNFYNHYQEHLDSTKPNNFGVIFADVNGLKRANDNFGHELGDILLTWSGGFLREQLGDRKSVV